MDHNEAQGWWVTVPHGMDGELSPMTFWNSEKNIEFQSSQLSWTVDELCSYLKIDGKRSSDVYIISKKIAINQVLKL